MINLSVIFASLRKSLGKKRLLFGLGIGQEKDKVFLYYRSNSDSNKIYRLAESKDGFDFSLVKKIKEGYHKVSFDSNLLTLITPRLNFFDNDPIEIEGVVEISTGTLFIYHTKDKWGEFRVGIAFQNKDEKDKISWRSSIPLWDSPTSWGDKSIKFIGLGYIDGRIIGYWCLGQKQIHGVIYPSFKLRNRETAINLSLNLERPQNNPIIKPNTENAWESFNTFNPAAIYENGLVHILYRAQGFDFVSSVGYAVSKDGIHVEERLANPIYYARESFEYTGNIRPESFAHYYMSGGGFGGIEDPRITRIDDRIYMLYVSFNGRDPPRIALTSILLEDFLSRRWLWQKAVLISPPGVIDKSAVIFPEKINGKYVIMHRIFPNILVDFVDDLNFDGTYWLEGKYIIPPRPDMWDSRKIGAGAPPIKTKDGWLLIYYATCDQEGASRYLIGAMLLDLNDPTKVLHRSKMPILSPEEKYENEGFKAGIVYPCGAVVIGETLFVYYGGADSHVCVATANLNEFVDKLKYIEIPILEPAIIERIA